MIAVDTNIIAYLFFPTAFSPSAEALYKADSDWIAPLLWRSEFRSVLSLYMSKQLVTLEKAIQIQDEAEAIMADHEFELPSSPVLTLIYQSHYSTYDCEFVALAHQLNLPLITQDKKLLNAFPSTAFSLKQFLRQKS